MHRKLLLAVAWLLLLPMAGFAQTDSKPVNYVIGVPARMTEADAGATLKGVLELILKGDPGSQVAVYDAFSLDPLLPSLAIPSGNQKRRLREVAQSVGTLKKALQERMAGRDPMVNMVRVPQFARVLARNTGTTRALIIGDGRYLDPRDGSFVFRDQTYPSDDHLLASPRASVFGTAGQAESLEGVSVYYCTVHDGFGTLYRAALQRFWACYLNAQGGALVLWTPSIETAMEKLRAGDETPIESDLTLAPSGGLMMLSAAAPKLVRPPEPSKTVVMFVTDGSISSKDRLALERAAYPRLASEFARSTTPIEFGVHVFRGKGGHDLLSPAPLTLLADGSPGPGLAAFLSFVKTKDVRATASSFAPGSEVATSSGREVLVSRMTPLGTSSADTGHGVREALRILSSLRPIDTPILVLAADTDSGEVYKGKAVATENARLLEEIRAFAASHPRARVVSIYSGHAKAPASGFFRAVSEAAPGKRGVYVDRIDTMESVLQALLRSVLAGSGS